jgi:hypothetical protein
MSGGLWEDEGLPMTKCMAEADLELLIPELGVVDPLFQSASPQHPARRWEYAMALRAAGQVERAGHLPRMALDIGGAGSPLHRILDRAGFFCHVVDPQMGMDLAGAVAAGMRAPFVTCVSVIEHTPVLERFLLDLREVVEEGGVLFLTADIWDQAEGVEDTADCHWMRERIFTPAQWDRLSRWFVARGFDLVGGVDWTYHGDHLGEGDEGYSFASMALRRLKASGSGE